MMMMMTGMIKQIYVTNAEKILEDRLTAKDVIRIKLKKIWKRMHLLHADILKICMIIWKVA
jgi:hypothetical protein